MYNYEFFYPKVDYSFSKYSPLKLRNVTKALFFIYLSFFSSIVFSQNKNSNSKPNIIVIVSDDQGWADVGWHGKEIRTPSLDRIMAEGMRLEQFYVQPVCSPTRAALMTGRYPMRYGLQVGVIRPHADYGLSLNERTLAEALRDAGYFTAICGKWHLGDSKKEYLPNQRGFDHHYGHYLGAIDYYKHTRDKGLDWHRNGVPLREKGYSTDLLADESIRLIQNHDNKKPLFLYLPFNAVHNPYQEAPNKEVDLSYSKLENKKRQIYAGMATAMDAAIGRVMQAVEKKGIKDNTIVFFCSDNGGPDPGVITDNGFLRNGKGSLYEGGIRVPAFITWPAKIKAGSVSNIPMHITDLYPTLLDIAGASPKQKLPVDGQNVKKVFFGASTMPEREFLLNASPYTGAIRKGNWKLVFNGSVEASTMPANMLMLNSSSNPKVELFDLSKDPGETTDVSALNRDKVKELTERYWLYAKQAVKPLNKNQPKDFVPPAIWGYYE